MADKLKEKWGNDTKLALVKSAAVSLLIFAPGLGYPKSHTFVEARKQFRRQLFKAHPDKGGSRDEFHGVVNAWQIVLAHYEQMCPDEVEAHKAGGVPYYAVKEDSSEKAMLLIDQTPEEGVEVLYEGHV